MGLDPESSNEGSTIGSPWEEAENAASASGRVGAKELAWPSFGEDAIDGATVMIVDDEEMVVRSLDSLLTLESRYRVRTFMSPRRALEAAREEEIHVVLADFLMPDLDGISFLNELRTFQPEATRLLLTGYADKENAIRAINDAGIYYYLEKPWDNEQLKIVIRNGIERSLLFRDLSEQIAALEEAHDELSGFRRKLVKAFL